MNHYSSVRVTPSTVLAVGTSWCPSDSECSFFLCPPSLLQPYQETCPSFWGEIICPLISAGGRSTSSWGCGQEVVLEVRWGDENRSCGVLQEGDGWGDYTGNQVFVLVCDFDMVGLVKHQKTGHCF